MNGVLFQRFKSIIVIRKPLKNCQWYLQEKPCLVEALVGVYAWSYQMLKSSSGLQWPTICRMTESTGQWDSSNMHVLVTTIFRFVKLYSQVSWPSWEFLTLRFRQSHNFWRFTKFPGNHESENNPAYIWVNLLFSMQSVTVTKAVNKNSKTRSYFGSLFVVKRFPP